MTSINNCYISQIFYVCTHVIMYVGLIVAKCLLSQNFHNSHALNKSERQEKINTHRNIYIYIHN